MKKISIRVVAGCILLVFFAISSFSQSASPNTKEGGKKVSKLDENKVPKEVKDIYIKDYPKSTKVSWYGYPSIDATYWYDDDPYLTSLYPENYVVKFSLDDVPYRAIYSKNGTKISTHRKLVSELPKAVSVAISNGEYKGWKIENDKEEIFKDKDSDQLKVYKIEVEKGKEKHTLYFETSGKLVKDKKLS